MTVEEATRITGTIQKAFPHMRMEPRLYIRALVHYEAEPARDAVLDAITTEWRRMPNVAEVVAALRGRKPKLNGCQTCAGDRLVLVALADRHSEEYAPCPDCHPLADSWKVDPEKIRELMKS